MALKKGCSVDQTTCGVGGAGGSLAGRGGVSAGGAGLSDRNTSLTHSISIVVELAKEPSLSQSTNDGEEQQQVVDNPTTIGQEMSGNRVANISGDSSEENEATAASKREKIEEITISTTSGEDEDEEDDGSECLASELSRKIVLVDEADRILRIRAQSAEPSPLTATPACLASARPPSPSKVVRDFGRGASIGSMSIRGSHHTRGGATGSSSSSSAMTMTTGCRCCTRRSIGGSSGELAERGELRKLGMRRNTHHQLGSAQLSDLAARRTQSRRPLSQTLSSTTTTATAMGTGAAASRQLMGISAQSNLTGPPGALLRNLPAHRRQSLQISLLSGGSCSPCKFLNEEEVRGEREFNEQLRSLKSPDSFYQQQKQQQLQLQSAVAAATSGKLDFTCSLGDFNSPPSPSSFILSSGRQQRCRSTSGLDPRELATVVGHKSQEQQQQLQSQLQLRYQQATSGDASVEGAFEQRLAATTTTGGGRQHFQQASGPPIQRHQQRRVSFSCLDPVIPSAHLQSFQQVSALGTRLAAGSTIQQQKRASIACHPGHFTHSSSGSSPTQPLTPPPPILKNATPIRLTRPPATAKDFQAQEANRQHPSGSSTATTTSGQLDQQQIQQKRHSVACSSFATTTTSPSPTTTPRLATHLLTHRQDSGQSSEESSGRGTGEMGDENTSSKESVVSSQIREAQTQETNSTSGKSIISFFPLILYIGCSGPETELDVRQKCS